MAGQFNQDDEDVIAEINMTPLIDIMLVLLILFMVTSSVSFQSGVDVDLPEVKKTAESSAPPSAIIISLDKKGQLFLQGEVVTLEALPQALRDRMEELGTKYVILEGDQNSSLGNTVGIMDIAKAAGAENFAIATTEN
jgi:biopolymer transport protein ExbD